MTPAIGAILITYIKVSPLLILLYRPHGSYFASQRVLGIFFGVGGDIRKLVFECCPLDVLASFSQTSWLCRAAVQEYLNGRLHLFLTPFVFYGQ